MKATFYGTRGSTPVSEKNFVQFGGNTSCVMLTMDSGHNFIFDAGTGIRKLDADLTRLSNVQPLGLPELNIPALDVVIVLSHTHWDHIQGFPFFKPAYDPQKNILLTICGKDRDCNDLENIFTAQMQSDFFPVPLYKMGAKINFWQPDINQYTGPMGITSDFLKHNHPGGAYSYRFTEGDKSFVYCTDIEHGDEIDQSLVEFSRDADLLIHDAQYTPDELKQKKGWGHSSWEQAVEVAEQAGVKKLALFHHDPEHDDSFLLEMEKECQKHFPNAFFAREGSVVEL